MPNDGNKEEWEDLGIKKSDLEGPKIDRRTTLKLLGPLAATAATGGLAGCTASDEGSGDSGGNGGGTTAAGDGTTAAGDGDTPSSDRYGGTVEAVWSFDRLRSLDPAYQNDGDEFQVSCNILNGITRITEEGEIVGDLAKDWTLPDESTYVFTFYDNITWHNGDSFSAEDAKWSLERQKNLDDSPHAPKLGQVDSIEASGNELTVHLSNPVAPFLSFLTNGPGRAGIITHRSAGENPEEYGVQPIGTGPFEITDRRVGEELTLTRFEDYFETDEDGNQLPYLDEVHIRMLPEPSTQWSAIQSGNAHLINRAGGNNFQQAKSSDLAKTAEAYPGHFTEINFLCEEPHNHRGRASYASGIPEEEITEKWKDQELPTTDPLVRKAITKAIDREEIVENAYFGAALPARQNYNPIIGWIYEEEPSEDRGQYYDPEEAERLLDEAGYTGDPRMELSYLGAPEDEREMTIIQDQLSDVGIKVNLNIKSPSAVNTERYEYINELFNYGGSSDIDPNMSHWKQRGGCDPDRDYVVEWELGTWSKSLYTNKAFDQQLIESYQTPSFEERREILHEAQRIHEKVDQEKLHEEDTVGPASSFTAFPLQVVVMRNELMNVGVPVGLTEFHEAYLQE